MKKAKIIGYEPEPKNGLFKSERFNLKVKPIFDKIMLATSHDYSDQMADAFRYAFINMPKLTLWQKIKRWFKRIILKLRKCI